MKTLDRGSGARVFVYTYKEGLLSAVAHDLKIEVHGFRIDVADDGTAVTATFDPSSLKVVTAMKDGAENPAGLPHMLFHEVEKNIVDDVLRPKKFPELRFASTKVTADAVEGTLLLCGRERAVRVARTREGDVEVGRARLDQHDFGIRPYTAMLGTLKIRAAVDVEIRLPLPPR